MDESLPVPAWKEDDRLHALWGYDILDTPPEKDYDDAASLAAQICDVPIALVNFVDADRQFFKARVGTELTGTSRDISLCQHAILQPGLFVVPDTSQDHRFKDNPLVAGEPHLRFYAGALLKTPEGLPIGTMCVLDYKPRQLSEEQAAMLTTLARMVMAQLELRRAGREHKRMEASLRSVLAAIPDCVEILGIDGQPEWINENGKRLQDLADPLVAKRPWVETWPDGESRVGADRALASARAGQTDRFRGFTTAGLGAEKWWDVVVSPIRDEKGMPQKILGISRDITEQRQVEQELIDSRVKLTEHASTLEQHVARRTAELQETISELAAYSYTVSHDLRAPIRAMQSFAECLREECSGLTPQGEDYIKRIVGAATRLDRLIQDVLVFSRLAKEEVPREKVDPNLILQSLLQTDFHLEAGQEAFRVPERLPDLFANEPLLSQCFSNLLGNAVKFVAPEVQPKITITSQRAGERVQLFFRDNGIGIDPRHAERIFGLFEQVDPKKGGTGAGLAVARRAAERMGGTLTLESSKPGQGSTFILDLLAAS